MYLYLYFHTERQIKSPQTFTGHIPVKILKDGFSKNDLKFKMVLFFSSEKYARPRSDLAI